jgi:hypothetical protein
MIPFIKSSEYFCGSTSGENVLGRERRNGGREKENSGLTE